MDLKLSIRSAFAELKSIYKVRKHWLSRQQLQGSQGSGGKGAALRVQGARVVRMRERRKERK